MEIFKPARHLLNPVLAGLLLAVLFLGLSEHPATAETLPAWQDTGISFNTDIAWAYDCLDPLQPGKLLTANPTTHSIPTYSIDLASGQKTQLNSLPFYHCNEATGQLYAKDGDFDVNGIRFSSADPAGKPIQYAPTNWAVDGSLWVYYLQSSGSNTTIHNLYASPDGGTTWRQIDTGKFQGVIQNMTVAGRDGRVLYVLTQDVSGPGRRYTLYASSDAGVSWEKRFEQLYTNNDPLFTPALYLSDQPEKSAPVDYVVIDLFGGAGSNGYSTALVSTDGGRTFVDIETKGKSGSYFIYYSDNSLVRFIKGPLSDELDNSVDGGKTWQPLALPFEPVVTNPALGPKEASIIQVPSVPSN